MNRRALVIAVVVGILGAVLLLLYQRRFEIEASGGERVRVLTVVKAIDRGKPILEDALATREIPVAYVEERAVRESDKQRILGLKATNSLRSGQTVLWPDIVAAEERQDVSALVLPGYRAVTIIAAGGDGALVRPGDYVDVIGVLGNGNGPSEQRSSVVLLQKVLVLATNGEVSPQAEKKEGYQTYMTTLTLSVTVSEGQLLSLASERGKLTVAIRHPEDPQNLGKTADIKMDSLLNEQARTNIVRSSGGGGGPVRLGGTAQ